MRVDVSGPARIHHPLGEATRRAEGRKGAGRLVQATGNEVLLPGGTPG